MQTEEQQPETAEGEALPVENEESTPSESTELGGEDATEETTDQESEKPKPKRNGFQKRISGLTEKNRELQARIDAIEAERNAPKASEPNRDDFSDYEQYLEARAEWKADQRFTELQTKAEARQAEQDRNAQQRMVEQQWDESQEAAREKYEDFDDVVYGDVSITDPMGLAIKDSKNGAEIAYYLGKNPQEADRIAKLTPIQQVAAMGAIEERLKARPAAKPPPKPVSRGRTSQTTASTQLNDNMPLKDWMALRQKQLGR